MCACASSSVCVCECECVGCVHIHICVYTGTGFNNDIPCLETVCIRISITLYNVHKRNHIKLLYTDLGRFN